MSFVQIAHTAVSVLHFTRFYFLYIYLSAVGHHECSFVSSLVKYEISTIKHSAFHYTLLEKHHDLRLQ